MARAGAASSSSGATSAILLAAAHLLEHMPPGVREVLKDLPNVLRRLEQRTGGVRRWIEEMDTTFAIEADVPPPHLVEARDAAQRWLTASVSALEAIQHELQRLRDGTGTVEKLVKETASGLEMVPSRTGQLHLRARQPRPATKGPRGVCRSRR